MAARLGIAPGHLRQEAEAGTIPFVRVGKGGFLFDPRTVEQVLSERASLVSDRKPAKRGGGA